jgi:hypothetical protein
MRSATGILWPLYNLPKVQHEIPKDSFGLSPHLAEASNMSGPRFFVYDLRVVHDDIHSGSLASDLIVVQNWYPKGSSASDIVQHKYLASELEVSHG